MLGGNRPFEAEGSDMLEEQAATTSNTPVDLEK
jgi:hypothetical protein